MGCCTAFVLCEVIMIIIMHFPNKNFQPYFRSNNSASIFCLKNGYIFPFLCTSLMAVHFELAQSSCIFTWNTCYKQSGESPISRFLRVANQYPTSKPYCQRFHIIAASSQLPHYRFMTLPIPFSPISSSFNFLQYTIFQYCFTSFFIFLKSDMSYSPTFHLPVASAVETSHECNDIQSVP